MYATVLMSDHTKYSIPVLQLHPKMATDLLGSLPLTVPVLLALLDQGLVLPSDVQSSGSAQDSSGCHSCIFLCISCMIVQEYCLDKNLQNAYYIILHHHLCLCNYSHWTPRYINMSQECNIFTASLIFFLMVRKEWNMFLAIQFWGFHSASCWAKVQIWKQEVFHSQDEGLENSCSEWLDANTHPPRCWYGLGTLSPHLHIFTSCILPKYGNKYGN